MEILPHARGQFPGAGVGRRWTAVCAAPDAQRHARCFGSSWTMRATMTCLLLAPTIAVRAADADPSRVEAAALALLEQQLVGLHTQHGLLDLLPPDAVVLGNGSFALARGPNAES